MSRSGREPFYDGLLTIGDPTGRLRSLRGTVSHCGRQLLLVAEFDIEELERINDKAIQLSNDLAQTQRELLSAHNKLKRREEEIRALSLTDQLTGIANRRKLDDAITAEYARALRYGVEFALVIADIDHFKRVNDEFGHDVGDAAIRAFAQVIQGQIRRTDLAARFGGEEFVVLMPESDAECALPMRRTHQDTIRTGDYPADRPAGHRQLWRHDAQAGRYADIPLQTRGQCPLQSQRLRTEPSGGRMSRPAGGGT